MKLYLNGTDNKYAAEQTLLTLFPGEAPEYPEGAPEGERCELSVTRGEKYAVCTAKLVRGAKATAAPRALNARKWRIRTQRRTT